MALVPIGSARIDERGKAIGGKGGDQNGKEVSTQAWYNRIINPWRVFRFKDPKKAKKAAQGMRDACNNKHIGYDQGNREGLYKVAGKYGYDPALVTTDTETDCSALIRVLLAFVGIFVGAIRTWTEPKALLDSGEFIELKGLKYTHSSAYLREGDILCTTRKGHTVMVLGNGSKSGAEDDRVAVYPLTPPAKSYLANWLVAISPVNLRTEPDANSKSRIVIPQGAGLMYDGAVFADWYAVMWRGKRHWINGKYVRVEVHEKPIVDLSTYREPKDWNIFQRWISFVILRVAVRHLTSNGPIQIDAKFKRMAKVCNVLKIPLGVYVYGRAKTAVGGLEEARKAIEFAEAYGPVIYFYDVEAKTCTHEAVQAFIDHIQAETGKPCGVYVGRMWDEVKMQEMRRAFTWCPYYTGSHSGIRNFGRKPSHPHDAQQNSPCGMYPGGDRRGCDNSFINDDPKTNGTGHDIDWLRSGGKEGR